MIKETCSCGATFEMEDLRWSQPQWANKGITVEQQEVLRWRETHRHEMPKPVYSPSFIPPGQIYTTPPGVTWTTNEPEVTDAVHERG